MFIVGILHWWYGDGARVQFGRVRERLIAAYDYFSLDLLMRSLFSPFRQISAGKVQGSLEVKFRAFIDNLISRAVGTVMRTILVVLGILGIFLAVVMGLVWLLVWFMVPFLPVIGVILFLTGWVPWTI